MNITVNMGEYYGDTPTVEQLLIDLFQWISSEGPERVAPYVDVSE